MDRRNLESSEQWDQEAAENDPPLPVYQLLEGITHYTGSQPPPSRPTRRPPDHQRSISSGALIYIPPSHKPSKVTQEERFATPEPCEPERHVSRESCRSPMPSAIKPSSSSSELLIERTDEGKSCEEVQPEENLEKKKSDNGAGEKNEAKES